MKNQKGSTGKETAKTTPKKTQKPKESKAAKNNQNNKDSKVKIKFTKSPTGAFGLAYSAGDIVRIEAKVANELIKAKFAKRAK